MKSKIAIILLLITGIGAILFFTVLNKPQEKPTKKETKTEVKDQYVTEEAKKEIIDCKTIGIIQSIETDEYKSFELSGKLSVKTKLMKNTKTLTTYYVHGGGCTIDGCSSTKNEYEINLIDEEYHKINEAWHNLCYLSLILDDYTDKIDTKYESLEEYKLYETKYKEEDFKNIDTNNDEKITYREYFMFEIDEIIKDLK